jgi:superfamily II DNA or RNA helicase
MRSSPNSTEVAEAWEIAISPSGSLRLVPASLADDAFRAASQLPDEFTRDFEKSAAAGLTFLASEKCSTHLSPTLAYWQRFAELYFRALCRQRMPADGQWLTPTPPDHTTLSEWLESAPPMRGQEYLTPEVCLRLWSDLDDLTRTASEKRRGGLAGYLHTLHPRWNLLGRVTFHLAENPKNEQRPFAFMATFTGEGSQPGRSAVQHVPLSTALTESIQTKDTRRLEVLLEPVSRAACSNEFIAELLESRQLFSPQAWDIRNAYQFLSAIPDLENAGVVVRVPNWWNASRPPRPVVEVRIGSHRKATLDAGGLDLQVGISIDGQPLTKQEIQQLERAREGLTFLKGKWVQVDQDRWQAALKHWNALQAEHVGGIDFLKGMRLLAGAGFGAAIDDDVNRWTQIAPGPWLEETLSRIREPDGTIKLAAQDRLKATLRPYQAVGARWLWMLYQLGVGGCLADDMGLGKTIQVIALLLEIQASQQKTKGPPSLLILPTSLLGNWQREIERFAPSLRLLTYHRSALDVPAMQRIASAPHAELADVDVVLTTYGLARREKWLTKLKWKLVVLDEAQAIKNVGSAQAKAIKAISSEGRLVLTGTPVENHLGDLWSLFDFCSPGLLGTPAQFKKFVAVEDPPTLSLRMKALRKLIRPFVLRRMKTDPNIVSDLPEKTEMRVDCGLTQTQATLYKMVTDELEKSLDVASGIQRRGRVLAALMQLKQICNHPALYLKQPDFALDASSKFAELRRICDTISEKQERLLVFTQFESMCQPLEYFLSDVFGQNGLVLTGKTPAKRRKGLVDAFQQPDGPPFFVISLKAGGTGLNLTEANHVVHFDRWWNPAVEDQATDRAFRIGQRRSVLVHKFVCCGTLEERIDAMIQSKKQISSELFDPSGEINLTELSNQELLQFVSLDLAKAMEG